jgi:hypothetical protein
MSQFATYGSRNEEPYSWISASPKAARSIRSPSITIATAGSSMVSTGGGGFGGGGCAGRRPPPRTGGGGTRGGGPCCAMAAAARTTTSGTTKGIGDGRMRASPELSEFGRYMPELAVAQGMRGDASASLTQVEAR